MNDEKEGSIMSRDVVNSGQTSIHGYLNAEEFMKALSRGTGWTSFSGLGLAVLLALGDSVHLWYTGPLAPTIVALVTCLVGYLRTQKIAARLMDEGEESK